MSDQESAKDREDVVGASTENENAEDNQDYDEEDLDDDEEIYENNHDLVGVDGIIRAQKNEIEKKKVSNRANNPTTYLARTENRE
jgi:hypothetical protein